MDNPKIGRVLHQDDDFVTIEVGKRDDVEWNLESGDAFWTLVFVRNFDGTLVPWEPWAE